MQELLNFSKTFIQEHITENSVVADFTMGNGHDTQWLCSLAKNGYVYAFDVQEQAVNNTRERLLECGYNNFELILDSHANCEKYIKGEIDAGMFNLGWLPGGDKSIHTLRESTIPAVFSAIKLLRKGGLITINVYPGHAEGKCEGELLMQELSALSKFEYCVFVFRLVNSPEAPFIIGIEKYNK
ncbi:MAG: class I SAM-dependent methyltransferase [Clostridia bacterium]|nr:class I SAM-dependent methyltransferase [Clostridia bacterium]